MSLQSIDRSSFEITKEEINELKRTFKIKPAAPLNIEEPYTIREMSKKQIKMRTTLFSLAGGVLLGMGAALLLTNPAGWAISGALFLGGILLIHDRIKIESKYGDGSFSALLLPTVAGIFIGGLALIFLPLVVPAVFGMSTPFFLIAGREILEKPKYQLVINVEIPNHQSMQIQYRTEEFLGVTSIRLEKNSTRAYIEATRSHTTRNQTSGSIKE